MAERSAKGDIMIKILVAENDEQLNRLISTCLTNAGYDVVSCFDGKSAVKLLKEDEFKLVLADVLLSGVDGITSSRGEKSSLPVMFITGVNDKPSNKRLGFELGLDDYIVKPFGAEELLLRISAVFRRINVDDDKDLAVGNLLMKKDEYTATVDGTVIPLTVREFDILYKLLSHPKKTFTRSQLMNALWDYDSSATSRTVDVYMAKIREKISACNGFEIVTVHGMGYKAIIGE